MSGLSCFVVGHDPMYPREKRIREGQTVRVTLEYECRRCGDTVESAVNLTPSWKLMARIRRQVPWARARSRRRT